MQEKTIPNYPKYIVRDDGIIFSLWSGDKLPLKQFSQKNGYKYVDLFNENGKKHFRVHRLVAEAFIPNPTKYPEVNHIDFNKENNDVSNLEWVSKKQNQNYTVSKNMKKIKLWSKQVVARHDGTTEYYCSLHECERKTGIDNREIRRVIKSQTPLRGYTFKYTGMELLIDYRDESITDFRFRGGDE